MKDKLPSILVIEDNPANLSVLFSLLDEAGFEVLVSLDGESASDPRKRDAPTLFC